MSSFTTLAQPLPGFFLLQRSVSCDHRGDFSRLFCENDMSTLGWNSSAMQMNMTRTSLKGTLRGMHFQHLPHAEKKLVTCVRGRVWDVVIDIRANSPTFLYCHAEELSSDNHRPLLIPEGFAHGFQTLCDDVEMIYCHSAAYHAEAEGGLNPFDPKLDIKWPLVVSNISEKDRFHPLLDLSFQGVIIS
jgi:dTDP-4-dehydrorhamnose 3,5-epimerase